VKLAYAIGVAEPVGVYFDTHGTGAVDELRIEAAVRKHFPMTPKGIIAALKLRRPIYQATAAFGHFGREEAGFEWEKTDKASALREELLGRGHKTARRALALA
jgi:S-adenosylmethionine synthetase